MKKIFAFALCLATVAGASAQKQAVNDAKKLSGKPDQIENARALIKSAMNNPETAKDAQTYFVAGNIEWDAFDKARTVQMINPDDPSIDPVAMTEQLLNGYNYMLQALPLDSLPDEKGKVKPKYSKDIINKISSHANDFFQAGANAFNAKKYYPEAYQAFMVFADMPDMAILGKNAPAVDPATRATAYFNAGLGAYSGNQVMKAADAFRKARLAGYEEPEAYIYELACWQNAMASDPSIQADAEKNIFDIATAGNEKFGMAQPIFIKNLVNCLVTEKKMDEALALVDRQLGVTGENADLYGLRAFVNVRNDKVEAAEADYRKAGTIDGGDFDTLKSASRAIFTIGTELWNAIEGTSPEAQAQRVNVRDNYWKWAMNVAEKAAQKNPNDGDLNDLMDRIEYNLETYVF